MHNVIKKLINFVRRRPNVDAAKNEINYEINFAIENLFEFVQGRPNMSSYIYYNDAKTYRADAYRARKFLQPCLSLLSKAEQLGIDVRGTTDRISVSASGVEYVVDRYYATEYRRAAYMHLERCFIEAGYTLKQVKDFSKSNRYS